MKAMQNWGKAVLRPVLALSLGACFSAGLTTAVWAQTSAAACPPVARQPTTDEIQKAQAEARDRGVLWRITKAGHTSYLFGTLHVGQLAWAPPGPTVRKALNDVDVIALELDISQPATLSQLQAALAGKPEDPPVGAALVRALAAETTAACLPAKSLDGLKPVVRALTLTLMAARWEGLDPAYAQEAVLVGVAEAAKLPIAALESVDEQMGAILPATTREAEHLIGQALAQLKSGAARRSTKRLAQAWAEGNLEQLASYERWCECVANEEDRQLLRRLNDDRNPAIASRIDRLHNQGKRVFAAVGALHMTGPKALPSLLAQRGFAVQQVTFPK
jgi:uncharacterized protein